MPLESPAATLDRFHRVLVDEIRSRRSGNLSDPFTVAEIYQHLVPYASHRDRLGVEMNGDYEDVLLRLLAGEGGYLRVESDHARERMQNELRSPNPDTSLYREFAAVDVRLNPDRVPHEGVREGDAAGAAGTAGDDVPVESLAPAASPGGPSGPGSPVEGDREPSPEATRDAPVVGELAGGGGAARAESGGPPTCQWCRAELPNRENLNYCPFCGTDVHVVPCPSCGEALESGWRFCIACGAGVAEEV